jgi:SpoIID/LytB domain protein
VRSQLGRGVCARRLGSVAAALLVLGATVGAARPADAAAPVGWVATVARFEPLKASTTGFSADTGPGHRGALEVRAGGGLVADLRLDDYVHGIQEVPSSWPAAAQRAQAIASRTYALNRVMAARRAAGWTPASVDLCATELCQVYTGIASERRPTAAAWQAAVTATRGHVLTYDGAPILAKYSASNGGRSVAGGSPTLPSVDDPDDGVAPHHRWSQGLQPGPLAKVLGSAGQVVAAERQGDVAVLTVDEGGARREIRLGANDLYNKVNASMPKNGLPRVFPSDRYVLSFRDGQVVADGNGYGHGVGMGQWGAMGKASRGLDHPAILASYYGPAKLSLPPAGAPTTVRVGLAAVANPAVRAVPTSGAPLSGFRVKADGKTVAVVAPGGDWSIVNGPSAGTVRIVPPAGYVTVPDAPDEAAPPAAPLSAVAAPATPAAAPTPAPAVAPAPPPAATPEPEIPVFAMAEPGSVLTPLPARAVAATRPVGLGSPSFAVVAGAVLALVAAGAGAARRRRAARRPDDDADPSVLA